MSVFVWIVISVMAVFALLLAYAFCKTASRTDAQDERMMNELSNKEK